MAHLVIIQVIASGDPTSPPKIPTVVKVRIQHAPPVRQKILGPSNSDVMNKPPRESPVVPVKRKIKTKKKVVKKQRRLSTPVEIPSKTIPAQDPVEQAVLSPQDQKVASFREQTDLPEGPRVLKDLNPLYPVMARKRGWEGSVHLKIAITPQGNPDTVEVIKSSGHRMLDRAALIAAKEMKFGKNRTAELRYYERIYEFRITSNR